MNGPSAPGSGGRHDEQGALRFSLTLSVRAGTAKARRTVLALLSSAATG